MLPSSLWGIGFFPKYIYYLVFLTDDNKTLFCTRYKHKGKTLYTAKNNQQGLGEYFRNRLGVFTNKIVITKTDFLEYGRTSIDFYKVDEENYLMDFSV